MRVLRHFLVIFKHFVEDILFDSSLKLETRFTLETTMKSGTQTKKIVKKSSVGTEHGKGWIA